MSVELKNNEKWYATIIWLIVRRSGLEKNNLEKYEQQKSFFRDDSQHRTSITAKKFRTIMAYTATNIIKQTETVAYLGFQKGQMFAGH